MECLDFKEVTDKQLQQYKEAVIVYNRKNQGSSKLMTLVSPVSEEAEVRLLDDLLAFKAAETRRAQEAAEKAVREKAAAAARREAQRLARLAKQLGVSVEQLKALKQTKSAKS